MPSSAMEPTYRCAKPAAGCSGDRADILVLRKTLKLVRGDVVAYRTPRRAMVLCGAGSVYVHRIRRVEAGGRLLFVVGDNVSQSCDSRAFGSVPAANVLGKVVDVRR
jgi:type IV secretory pathway protease TraF